MAEKDKKSKSATLIEEVKRRKHAKKIVRIEEERVKLVIFTLLHNYFAFFGCDVKEILPLMKINFVPGAPKHILGIINVRGDIESVLDINGLVGVEANVLGSNQRIIIAEKDGVRSGILVDSVEDVLDVPKSSINETIPTLNEAIKNFVVGQTNYKSQNTTLLEVGRIFGKMMEAHARFS